jgi:hypothetical protein
MVPPCALTIVRTIVRPIPRPCGFVVTKGVNRAEDIRRQARSRVAHRDIDIGGPDVAADCDATTRRRCLGHGVHGVHHQVHQHLLQEHLIAGDDAGIRRQIDGGLDLPRAHVVSDERKTLTDHGVNVDRFLVQLMTAEHCPMPIDDLCGLDALALDVGKELAPAPGVARLTAIIIRPALALWIIELRG